MAHWAGNSHGSFSSEGAPTIGACIVTDHLVRRRRLAVQDAQTIWISISALMVSTVSNDRLPKPSTRPEFQQNPSIPNLEVASRSCRR